MQYSGRSRRCLWAERLTGSGFTMLESDAFPGHFLGFTQRGKFLPPNEVPSSPDCPCFRLPRSPFQILQEPACFQFLKLETRSPIHDPYPGMRQAPIPAQPRSPALVEEGSGQDAPSSTFTSTTTSTSTTASPSSPATSPSPWADFAAALARSVRARVATVAPTSVTHDVLAGPALPPRRRHRLRHRHRHRHHRPRKPPKKAVVF